MQHSNSTRALTTTILGLLFCTACSASSNGNGFGDANGLGGNVANGGADQKGGSVATPGSGGNGPSSTLGSGGTTVSGNGGSSALGGLSSTNGTMGGNPAATGGKATSASVGGASTGGSNSTGGKATSSGGVATGGNAAGGAATGGKAISAGGAATGGAATGGKATSAGGAATGGKAASAGGAATGGAATGGKATGGAATGGKATGGAATTGGATSSGIVSCGMTLPASTGTKTLTASQSVSGTFDGGMVQYCGGGSLGNGGDAEGQDPLFNIANGGTLKNVIIGGSGCSAADGVHCAGSCTLENVWWGDVGEDAATFRGGATKVVINGGGAFSASDKVFQDNTTGGDLVTITNFFVSTAGKLYRSCGTCTNDDRHVVIQNVAYKSVSQLVGLNTNNGDTAKITGLIDCGGNGTICAAYTWVAEGTDPPRNGTCSY
jgi:pectate lyase